MSGGSFRGGGSRMTNRTAGYKLQFHTWPSCMIFISLTWRHGQCAIAGYTHVELCSVCNSGLYSLGGVVSVERLKGWWVIHEQLIETKSKCPDGVVGVLRIRTVIFLDALEIQSDLPLNNNQIYTTTASLTNIKPAASAVGQNYK